MSFGAGAVSWCTAPNIPDPNDSALCLAITHATNQDVSLVGASGNDRAAIQFPANDDRVIAVGGLQPNLAIWSDWPNCPFPNSLAQCASNYTNATQGPKQELAASAKSVVSTTYPGVNWNAALHCGDGAPGPGWGNGIGLCTGTSMSSP